MGERRPDRYRQLAVGRRGRPARSRPFARQGFVIATGIRSRRPDLRAARAIPQSLPDLPTRAEIREVIPDECFERSLGRSLAHAGFSVVLTVGLGLAALAFIPLTWAWLPAWLLYAAVAGTASNGVWVAAHECGHRAFCNGTKLQDAIGFVLHSALLVPYFSWQRSHAVHHAKTNHVVEGETHVPTMAMSRAGKRTMAVNDRLGRTAHGVLALATNLTVGWPMYLLIGATGGAERGTTNHFWPSKPFSPALFPGRWPRKVKQSALGVLVTVALLVWWAVAAGSIAPVIAVYVGPYLVGNAWLVTYTWLQHTDVDVAHYEDPEWSYVRGAFATVDRPYGPVFDLLHHRIGSTHVVHHLDAKIPHYRAKAATDAIAAAYPDLYRYDPTPIPAALWRVATECHVVSPTEAGWMY